ncbi:MAG: ABC transporter permease [Coriobacteriia bacterium]|nr:ABC transporter permease [Coriobacteriia bacterium]
MALPDVDNPRFLVPIEPVGEPVFTDPADEIESHSLWRDAFKRLLKDRLAVISAIIIIAVIGISILAPVIAPYAPNEMDLAKRLQPIGTPGHILGTDQAGRDILSRLIWGGRISVAIGVGAVAAALVFGVLIGLIAGFYKGPIDTIANFGLNILMAFPYILLAISIITALGPGLTNAMIAIAIVGIPYYARIVRGSVLSLREQEFVQAEIALGASNWRIIFKHILPNVLSPIIVAATLDVGWMIVMASGLSFLGLGAQPPTAEWGLMLSEGQKYIRNAPYVSLLPGLMIFIVVLALNFLGDGLRDALDPKLKQ